MERWLSHGLETYVQRCLIDFSRLRVDHPSVLYQRGELTMAAGLLGEAEALFRRGLTMAPAHFKLHRGLAEVLQRQGLFGDASEVLAEANEQTPGLGWLIVLEAETLLQAGLPARAWAVLESAEALIDDAYRGPLVRAKVLETLGRIPGAREPARPTA